MHTRSAAQDLHNHIFVTYYTHLHNNFYAANSRNSCPCSQGHGAFPSMSRAHFLGWPDIVPQVGGPEGYVVN